MEPDTPAADPPVAQARPTPRWGLGDVVLGLFVGLVMASVFGGIWVWATGQDELSLWGKAFSQVGLWVGLAGVPVVAGRRKGSGRVAVDFGWRGEWRDLPVGAAIGVASQLLLVPLVLLLLRPLLGHPDVSGPVTDLVDKAQGATVLSLVLVAVIGAPLVEELFFRGLLLRSLQKRFSDGWSIVLTSAAFGLAHPNNLPVKGQILVMVALAAFGGVLATLAVRTKRLGPGIVAHACFNAVSLYVAFHR